MKSGDLIQIQKHMRFQQCNPKYSTVMRDYELFPALSLQPGEVYLMTDLYMGEENYPIYSYFEITILAAGKQWETIITVDSEDEINDYIRVFESPTLSQRG